jgi:hypothetical protein
MVPLSCACEAWSHTVREQLKLWLSENKVLRGMSGPFKLEDGKHYMTRHSK